MVTSDSLASESIQEGGSFGASSDARGPMSQPSYSTTTNTADISNAERLDPAPDAEARQASEAWSESAQLNAGIGLGKEAGRGPTWNTPDVSDSTNRSSGGMSSGGMSSGGTSSGGASGGGTVGGGTSGGVGSLGAATTSSASGPQPHGKNITEGGFDENAPNASFNTDIGGKDDPGRAALGGFQQENVPSAGGVGPREGEVTNDGQYDVLKDESA